MHAFVVQFGRIIMSNNANIQEIMKEIQQVMEAAHTVIETMQVGERKQIKELAQDVSLMVAKDPKAVLGFVNHFAHNTNIAYVTRGKNGGIVRGSRPVKTIKASKKVKTVDAASTTDTVSA
jgi:hypothetical protein